MARGLRNPDGTRSGFGAISHGGLPWDSLPLQLFQKGNARFWNPADIDFSKDAEDWQTLNDDERWSATALCAQFLAGEEAVAEDIQPFMAAMSAEGRLADELYLTQFAFEEAKHVQVFRLWLDAIGLTEDLHEFVATPAYRQIFYEELPLTLRTLTDDPSPANQVRASATYNHVVEGMLALTGYFSWRKVCEERDIMPGMRQAVRLIGDDERRHMAWGTFTCRRHVAADDQNWNVFSERMGALIPLAMALVTQFFDLYDERAQGRPLPFGLDVDELLSYAMDKGSRRLGTIESARGRPLREIDYDISPLDLEEQFAIEDTQALANA